MCFKEWASAVRDECEITVPLITVDLAANQHLLNKRLRDEEYGQENRRD